MASHGIPRYQQSGVKSDQAIVKETRQIEEYRSLVQQVTDLITGRVFTRETVDLTSKLLIWNPEYYTIWNYRRHVIEHILTGLQAQIIPDHEAAAKDVLVSDMQFLVPLLIKFPKCYWIWNHRYWLLQQCSKRLLPADAEAIWVQELGLVSKMLSRDSRNFHGWGYRRFIISELEEFAASNGQTGQIDGISTDKAPLTRYTNSSEPSLTEIEFKYTTKMININLSNFSAWHNRSKLIPKLLDERQSDNQARRTLFDDELALIQRALFTDPYDQSLWFYHEYLIITLCSGDDLSFVTFTDNDRFEYLEREISEIRTLLEDTTDCKLIYQHLLLYAELCLQLGMEHKAFSASDMQSWLAQLMYLDPLRRRRWEDLAAKLNLE